MDEKKYMIGDDPASANDIIRLARNYDVDFANDWLQTTSRAAEILRENGFRVWNNPEYVQAV